MSKRALKCECGECKRCKHRDYMREYLRRPEAREKQAARKARWYRENADRIRKHVRDYREENIEQVRVADRARGYRVYDPLKTKARRALLRAIKSGRVERQPCELCGDPKSHGHHDDYSKPLDVRWLCSKHHGELHRVVS